MARRTRVADQAGESQVGVLPDIIRPQLATLVDRPPVGPNWSYEIKFDGYRMLCRIDNGAVTLFTRNGHDWTDRMPALAAALAGLPVSQAWIDGEVVVLNKADIPDFSALQNAFARRRTAGLTFFAFDLMFLDGRDLRKVRLGDRQAILLQLLASVDDAHIRLSNTFTDGVESLLDSACRMGLEGLIGKRVDRPYMEGRSPDWIKVKCLQRQEFVIRIRGSTDWGIFSISQKNGFSCRVNPQRIEINSPLRITLIVSIKVLWNLNSSEAIFKFGGFKCEAQHNA